MRVSSVRSAVLTSYPAEPFTSALQEDLSIASSQHALVPAVMSCLVTAAILPSEVEATQYGVVAGSSDQSFRRRLWQLNSFSVAMSAMCDGRAQKLCRALPIVGIVSERGLRHPRPYWRQTEVG
jgi:hypothetical protein